MSSWQLRLAAVVCGCLVFGGMTAGDLLAQDPTSQQGNQAQPAAGADKSAEVPPAPKGKVLFSRSVDDKSADDAGTQQPATAAVAASQATESERNSLTFVAYDLDVRLVRSQESLAVKARMTVRNDGEHPLKRISLQLSSTLKWERFQAAGSNLRFAQHPVDSDADHTGTVNEAVITLPSELAPKAELSLEAFYSGQIALTGERLERVGAPTAVAEKSDWDRVSADFVGLRGFGNVVWYPVSASPVMLGDGAKLFTEIGRQKLRNERARFSLRLTSEFSAEAPAPNLAVLNGTVVPVVQTAAPEDSYPGVVTASLPDAVLGFSAPSLFLLSRQKVDGNGVRVFVTTDDLASTQSVLTAVNVATPLVQQWLGPKPKSVLTVVGLADAGDASAEQGSVFFTAFQAVPDPKELDNAMVHSLAHAYFHSPQEWLDEGVPQFLDTLWIEQVQGRQAALESLESARGALALAEPGTPGESGGEELTHASDSVYYRTKSAFVFWMLRDLAGDTALAAALQAYVPEEDITPDYFERLLEKSSGKDLKWFFDAWVYHDRGLPDLSMSGVFPSKAAVEGQWLVALDVANDGYAEAEVPVTLRSKDTKITERLRIPARGKVSRRMLIQGLPTEVQLNDGTVPEVAESIHLTKLVKE